MRRIELETGDILTGERVGFILEIDNGAVTLGPEPGPKATLTDLGREIELLRNADCNRNKGFWASLLQRSRLWDNLRYDERIDPNVRRILKLTNTTPRYQLFLAAIDLAQLYRFVDEEDRMVMARALIHENFIHTFFEGAGGVFLLPTAVTQYSPEILGELLDANCLGKVKVTVGNESVERYYIPYATPIGSKLVAAKDAWQNIRQYYYDRR